MVDCATGEYGISPYPNNGCNGGLMESAFTYSSQGLSANIISDLYLCPLILDKVE